MFFCPKPSKRIFQNSACWVSKRTMFPQNGVWGKVRKLACFWAYFAVDDDDDEEEEEKEK